ncbi:uncharacterized protein FYW47_004069 [Aplochiton taeniatus]
MGTNKETDMEQPAQQQPDEMATIERDKAPEEENPQRETPPEDVDPLNTYKWHTGSKGNLAGARGEGGGTPSASSTMEKLEKSTATKWSKVQNWRKALSEDPGDRACVGKGGDTSKPEKMTGIRKNPFRRALSEPPGSLFAALTPSSPSTSAQGTPGPASAEASGCSSANAPHKGGGGALFRKYLRTVSQKLKRPRLQSRTSLSALQPG